MANFCAALVCERALHDCPGVAANNAATLAALDIVFLLAAEVQVRGQRHALQGRQRGGWSRGRVVHAGIGQASDRGGASLLCAVYDELITCPGCCLATETIAKEDRREAQAPGKQAPAGRGGSCAFTVLHVAAMNRQQQCALSQRDCKSLS